MARTAAGTLGLKIAAAGLGFANSVLLARLLGPAEFGLYAIVLAGVNLATTLAVLGLPMLTTREVAASAEHQQWSRLKGFLVASHRWTLLAVAVILGLTAALLVGSIAGAPVSWPLMFTVLLLIPVGAFGQLRAAILRGLHWVILADVPEMLLRPAVMLLLLFGFSFAAIEARAVDALALYLAAGGLALALGAWWLTTRQPVALKEAIPEPMPRAWILQALPFLGIALVGMLEGQVPLYLLGYLGDTGQAGLFQAASQLVGLISMGLVAVNMPLQPRLAAAWAREDKGGAQRLLGETARMGTGMGQKGAGAKCFFRGSSSNGFQRCFGRTRTKGRGLDAKMCQIALAHLQAFDFAHGVRPPQRQNKMPTNCSNSTTLCCGVPPSSP